MGHFKATLFNGKSQLTLDQIKRVLAESFKAPAFEDRQLAHACCQCLQLVRLGQQAARHIDFAGANFQQQLEKVRHQRTFLAQRCAALGLGGHFFGGQRL